MLAGPRQPLLEVDLRAIGRANGLQPLDGHVLAAGCGRNQHTRPAVVIVNVAIALDGHDVKAVSGRVEPRSHREHRTCDRCLAKALAAIGEPLDDNLPTPHESLIALSSRSRWRDHAQRHLGWVGRAGRGHKPRVVLDLRAAASAAADCQNEDRRHERDDQYRHQQFVLHTNHLSLDSYAPWHWRTF